MTIELIINSCWQVFVIIAFIVVINMILYSLGDTYRMNRSKPIEHLNTHDTTHQQNR